MLLSVALQLLRLDYILNTIFMNGEENDSEINRNPFLQLICEKIQIENEMNLNKRHIHLFVVSIL